MSDAGIRVKMDEREGVSPGFKFNDWEMRGVPLRLELGPKDVAKGSVVLARRDRPGKEGKAFVPQQGIAAAVAQMLEEIQKALYDRALAFRKANTAEPADYEEFKKAVEKGFAFAWWCGSGRMRSENQGRDQGDDALHSSRTARRHREVHSLRRPCERKGHFRQGLLAVKRLLSRVYSFRTHLLPDAFPALRPVLV